MAKDNKISKLDDLSTKSSVRRLMGRIQQGIGLAYKKSHFSQPSNSNDLDFIKTSLDNTIDNIVGKNEEEHGLPSISGLYNKIQGDNKDSASSSMVDLEQMFTDSANSTNMMASIVQNNQIREYDSEIDTILMYVPSLEDALEAKKDNVLSADHFNKDFLNIVDSTKTLDEETIKKNFEQLKKDYNLIDKLEHFYEHTAKYGETFVYLVPYKKALAQLLARDKIVKEGAEDYTFVNENAINEDSGDIKFDIFFESTTATESKRVSNTKNVQKDKGSISVQIDTSGVLFEAAKEVHDVYKFNNKLKKSIVDFNPAKMSKDMLEAPERVKQKLSAQDGFMNVNDKQADIEKKLKIPGCIMRDLDRSRVLPLFIDEMILGYYYIETNNATPLENPDTSMLSTNRMFGQTGFNGQVNLNSNYTMEDNILKNVSKEIADRLDVEFVAANPQLKDEIYRVLKYNSLHEGSTIKITFLPPEDVVYMYFKWDPKTKRGVSDLDKAMYPAKLYASVDTCNILGILTRSADKRAIYVKQQVDTNTSGVLLNTINQIKRGNFGSRELPNIKNLLNITGRFNDYIIPVGPSGDAPIQFEMMPGQTIDTQEALLNRLEEQAVNTTDVPFEYIQSRKNVDYAVRLTMSSGKFLRKVYKRQAKTEELFSIICDKIYKSEYCEEGQAIEFQLEVILPPPTLLNILNTNQMFSNLNDLAEFLIPIIYPDDDNDNELNRKRALFKSKLQSHYLGTTIDMSNINIMKHEVDSEVSIEKSKAIGSTEDDE